MNEPGKPIADDSSVMQTDPSLLDVESATLVADEAGARRPVAATLDRGSSIGRYVVLDQLGAGGMGVVYAAYDPELDRKIAIKVLLDSALVDKEVSGGKARLVREAQALARLSHPNVVNVHDVGEQGGRVFVAMEHVDGATLKQWLARKPRELREILDMFVAAGRGLSAAHAAGLVHRDFKPDNVLVGVDGRPRVVDFGLARGQPGVIDSEGSESNPVVSGTSSVSELDNDLTAVGAVMGTPAYMAAEQHVGGKADAATDQFAFCVALYKALYGERPFPGSSLRALARAVCRGKVRPAPAGSNVPGWLRRVVVRGLAPLAEERHVSMDALLVELSRDPAASRKRGVLVAVGLVTVAGVGIGAYVTGAADRDAPCVSADQAMDAVWNDDRHAAMTSAFTGAGVVYAGDTLLRVEKELERYAAEWRDGARAACEATHVTQTQSVELLDRRVACLDVRREAMDAMLEVFVNADAGVVERAASAVNGLPAVGSCADLSALNRGFEPPSSDSMRAEVDALTVAMERAAATYRAGRYKEVLPEREALVERAERIGYMPTLARAVHELAMAQGEMGMPEATDTTRRAFALALESGHLIVGARTAIDLAHEFGARRADASEGNHWRDVGLALARRAGGDLATEMSALNVAAIIAKQRGEQEEARHRFEDMLRRLEAEGDDGPNVAVALMNLGALHAEHNEFDKARDYLTRAAERVKAARGPRHPSLLQLRANLAMLSAMRGDYSTAREEFVEVVELQREVYGARHLDVARSLAGQAIAERHLGNLERAETLYLEALSQRREFVGEEHRDVAEALRNLALVRADQGRDDEALELARQSLAMETRLLADDHPRLALSHREVGGHLVALERYEEALPHLSRAQTTFSRLASDRTRLVETLLEIGAAHRGLGDEALALSTFERALELSQLESVPRLRARASLEVAIGLRDTGGDAVRARRLATQARAQPLTDPIAQRRIRTRAAEFFGDDPPG